MLAAVFLVRIFWVMGFNTALRLKNHFFGVKLPRPMLAPTFRGGVIMSWCGMRGVVTVAAALSLPIGFPQRDLIQVVAFAVVLGTLLIQGLTLRPLMACSSSPTTPSSVRRTRRASWRSRPRWRCWTAAKAPPPSLEARVSGPAQGGSETEPGQGIDTEIDILRREAIAAGRQTIVDLRSSGEIGDDAFHVIEAELDIAEVSAAGRGAMG